MSHRAIGRTVPHFKRQVRGQVDGAELKFHNPCREFGLRVWGTNSMFMQQKWNKFLRICQCVSGCTYPNVRRWGWLGGDTPVCGLTKLSFCPQQWWVMMSDGVFGVGSGEQNVLKQHSTKLIQKAEKGQSWGKHLLCCFMNKQKQVPAFLAKIVKIFTSDMHHLWWALLDVDHQSHISFVHF